MFFVKSKSTGYLVLCYLVLSCVVVSCLDCSSLFVYVFMILFEFDCRICVFVGVGVCLCLFWSVCLCCLSLCLSLFSSLCLSFYLWFVCVFMFCLWFCICVLLLFLVFYLLSIVFCNDFSQWLYFGPWFGLVNGEKRNDLFLSCLGSFLSLSCLILPPCFFRLWINYFLPKKGEKKNKGLV